MESAMIIEYYQPPLPPPPPPPPATTIPEVGHIGVLCEILSRCCVKSLMRLKCVCKDWRFLIEQDLHFIHSHFSQSIKHPYLLLYTNHNHHLGQTNSFLSVHGLSCSSSFQTETISPAGRGYMLKPVNGLTCFIYRNSVNHGCSIFNINTRESTPILKILLKNNEDNPHYGSGYYGFGYDPESKEHKVVGIWHKYGYNISPSKIDRVCEVLTVGDNKWRRIDDAVPGGLYGTWKDYVYVNGAIYWSVIYNLMEVLLVFHVGSERFRLIQLPADNILLPRSIINNKRLYDLGVPLLNVDHRLALVHTTRHNNNKVTIKMWIVDEKDNWIEETVLVIIGRKEDRFHCFRVMNDKVVIVTKSRAKPARDNLFFNVYYCNWDKNSTCRKIEITTSTIGGRIPITKYHGFYNFTTSVQTLLPLQNQHTSIP